MEQTHQGLEPQQNSLSGARVLVVEDEYILLLDLELVLSEAGGAIVAVRSVERGLEAIEAQSFDVAILDFRLGRDSAEPVAQALARRGVPFLFYTGQTSQDPALRRWPSRQVLPKPAHSETIVAAVARLLRR